jgi:hypothetical protein
LTDSKHELLLWIDGGHYFAGAIWRKHEAAYRCIAAAPILKWMRGRDANDRELIAYVKKQKAYGWMRIA